MIPLRLRVRNFLCYGEDTPELDLAHVRLACLCGENGAGKSALLDAMCWALWGTARRLGRSSDELVHRGAEYAQVELEFLARDVRHRVVRRHEIGRGTTRLTLEVWSDNAGWRSISKGGVRETERQIEATVGMDYDTFITSAYLVQGRADEFTLRRAGERKQVLANILGLERFERYRQRARDRAVQARGSLNQLEASIRAREERLQERPALQRQLQEATARLNEAEAQRDRLQAEVEQLKERLAHLRQKEAEGRRIRKELEDTRANLARWHQMVAELEGELSSLRDVLSHREEITAQAEELERLKRRQEELQHLREQRETLEREQLRVTLDIEREKATLESALGECRRSIARLEEALAGAEEARRQLKALRADLARLQTRRDEVEKRREEAHALSAREGELRARLEQVATHIAEARSHLSTLESAGAEARCPVCQTQLGPDRIAHLRREYEAELQRLTRERQSLATALREVEHRRGLLAREIKEAPALEREASRLQRLIALAERELAQAEKAGEEMESLQRRRAEIERSLSRKSFAPHLQERLRELSLRIGAIPYSPEEHRAVRARLAQLEGVQARVARLEQASAQVPRIEKQLQALTQMCDSAERALKAGEESLRQLSAQLAELPRVESELESRDRLLQGAVGEVENARSALQRAQLGLDELDRIERELEEDRKRLAQLTEEARIYAELERAFSRNGVQALIIDSVIPQIQDRANEILRQLTDGRFTVKLSTQRITRSGSASETLEIDIQDELGTRKYETFSGGEAFRINLALRLALSQILVERNRLPGLPLLIIDEGFGTQDTVGRDRVISAIQAIQDRFQKVLVISHLEDVKERFPHRIEVRRTPTGSTFEVTW